MSIESEANSFAYGSSMHGGRPTFALTRRLGEDAGLTLYEFIPESLANGRQKRLRRANINRTLSRLPITEALPDVSEDATGRMDFARISSSSERTPNNWDWEEWWALKIRTLRGKRQQAVHRLVRFILGNIGLDTATVTRGEGSAILAESDGVRLTIAFLAMKELQKYGKLTTVADSITQMSLEECYYWHAKCRSPSNPNGVTALRQLLVGHIK